MCVGRWGGGVVEGGRGVEKVKERVLAKVHALLAD